MYRKLWLYEPIFQLILWFDPWNVLESQAPLASCVCVPGFGVPRWLGTEKTFANFFLCSLLSSSLPPTAGLLTSTQWHWWLGLLWLFFHGCQSALETKSRLISSTEFIQESKSMLLLNYMWNEALTQQKSLSLYQFFMQTLIVVDGDYWVWVQQFNNTVLGKFPWELCFMNLTFCS